MSTASPAPSSPGRAALLGLSAGLVIAALYLGVRAFLASQTQCEPGALGEECALEQSIARDLMRLFLLSAAGLLCVGVGLYVFTRKKP